jgi:colanic acid/amylovoran biosynthesis glycosyltransferase
MKLADHRAQAGASDQIAYLTTQYPAVSHSFIRREILGIEACGEAVERYSIRPFPAELPDPRDRTEAARTTVVLNGNLARLAGAALLTCLGRPVAFLKASACAFGMARKAGGDLVKHGAYLLEACWLSRQLDRKGVRHLHVHFGTNATAVARIIRKLGGPTYSFTVHGPDEFDRPVQLDLRGKIADAAFCVAISSYGRSQLMRWSHYADWPKIRVVRCGVDETFTTPIESMPVPDAPRLCCVARLSGQKGLPLLIEAAAKLAQRGTAFHLTLVGGGEMQDEIEHQIAAAGLQDRVTLAGWASAEEVRRIIQASRAMVLPSFAEGLPVVIMEALALERPVVTTMIAGIPELVDEACGWLVPAGDVDALVEAMRAAIEASPEDLAKMGGCGRERVLAMHRADSNAAALLEMIRGGSELR